MELKPRCNSPSSVPSNTTTLAERSPSSTRRRAARTIRTGVAVNQAWIHIRMKPKTRAAAELIRIATSNCPAVRLRRISENSAVRPKPIMGRPELTVQMVMVRPMMPGASRCGGFPAASAMAATGRSANSANR